ncbi:MAG: Stp1/IreP family PP2C-type Ser/Thr phosphatase [bacterium]
MEIKVTTAARSDIGNVRKANEDSYFISKNENLIIVCDGMGGQIAGGLASKIAVETIKDIYYDLTKEQLLTVFDNIYPGLSTSTLKLIASVRIANRRIYTQTTKLPRLRGMGTTVVALTFDKNVATMVHVGDSRIFRISDKKILQLTEDHSWLNELIEDNEINEEEIETFAQKNVITRALGTAPTVKIDVHCEKYKKGDLYVLCTDGLHNSITGKEINGLFRKNQSLDKSVSELLNRAKKRDGSDNITIAAVQTQQDCHESRFTGVSITIAEETEKGLVKEDKYIQRKYLDPKNNHYPIKSMAAMTQNRLMFFGAILFTAIVCFLFGVSMQNKKQNRQYSQRTLRAATGPATKTSGLPGKMMPQNSNTPMRSGNASHQAFTKRVDQIKRSELSEDAVLAFVLFNSNKDYENAMLETRGSVLDKLSPYSHTEHQPIQGDFSIFLIDSSNNVIRKTSGIKLPVLSNRRILQASETEF